MLGSTRAEVLFLLAVVRLELRTRHCACRKPECSADEEGDRHDAGSRASSDDSNRRWSPLMNTIDDLLIAIPIVVFLAGEQASPIDLVSTQASRFSFKMTSSPAIFGESNNLQSLYLHLHVALSCLDELANGIMSQRMQIKP